MKLDLAQNKKNIAVLFGGQSSEHEVSCVSAANVISLINTDKYNIIMIGITKDGRWLYAPSLDAVKDGSWKESRVNAIISPDAGTHGMLMIDAEGVQTIYLDVIFPVLHGLYGEDGTVQGLIEMAGIPYVGCGVLASAVSMDKLYTKIVVDSIGVRQAKYVAVMREELEDEDNFGVAIARVEKKLSYPVFVKPSRAGSSCGVSKAENRAELRNSLTLASKHDRKILVEETIVGREIECAVLGGKVPDASGVGEILAAAEFYDYDAKYNNAESKTITDPDLPEDVVEQIRRRAVSIFRAVDGYGLARVDFFVTKEANEVVFNEINTLPGFTPISMYPMLWQARGIEKTDLVEQLIQLAYKRTRSGAIHE